MGVFHSKDELDELRKRFLQTNNDTYEILIQKIVKNLSNLISPRYKDKMKTLRIENAAQIMYNTTVDVIEYIELDETDLDDVMILNDQIIFKIEMINNPDMNTTQWIELWDDTQDKLTELHNILSRTYITYSHQKYYKTMLNIKKAIRIMYVKRHHYSPKPYK